MPVYRDPETGKSIRSTEPLSDAELEEAFGGQAPTSSPVEKAGKYLLKRGADIVQSAQNLQADVAGAVTGKPMFAEPRGAMDTLGDVAAVAGPAIAPGLSALGAGAGAIASGAGTSQDTAELIDMATQIGAGVGSAAIKGAGAAKGAKAALQARYDEIAAAATARGRTIQLGTQVGDDLAKGLEDAVTDWGGASAREVRAVKGVIDKLTTPGGAGVTYGDLDQALKGLTKVRGPSTIRSLMSKAAAGLLEGTPEAAALKSTSQGWRSLMGKPMLSGTMRTLGAGAGVGYGINDIRQGNYGKAAVSFGLAGLGATVGKMSPGQLSTAARAAGPVLGRTAASVAGTAAAGDPEAVADATIGPTEAPGAPQEPGVAPEAPGEAPAQATASGPMAREIQAISELVGVPIEFIEAIHQRETGHIPTWEGRVKAVSPQGAVGPWQIMPDTFQLYSKRVSQLTGREAHIHDPLDNLIAGALHMRDDLDATGGDVGAAAARYHGGPDLRQHGPKTRAYEAAVTQDFLARAR